MSNNKTALPSKSTKNKHQTMTVEQPPGKSRETLVAELALSSVVTNASTAVNFLKNSLSELGITESVAELKRQTEKIEQGDLTDAETMLAAQAVTLNAIFTELARRSALNMGEYLEACERYMRLALKAQGQCRATLETLAAIKHPPVIFAKQANIANGPQQVNNGTPISDPGQVRAHAHAHAGTSDSEQNELLEHHDGKRLDTRTAGTASGKNPAVAAVGKIDRAKKRKG